MTNLQFSKPSRGRAAARTFLASCFSSFPDSTRVIVDDITDGSIGDVAVTFHMEVNGVEAPDTRGVRALSCSRSILQSHHP